MAAIAVDQRPPVDGDLVRSYLRDIGRVPLLSHEQEITLGRQVRSWFVLKKPKLSSRCVRAMSRAAKKWLPALGFPRLCYAAG